MTHRYLLIIGAPKAATTSLFRYLSDHPDVCGAAQKETYFFARDFDEKQVACAGTKLSDFEQYFRQSTSPHQLRVEGSPYTMYTKDAARSIAETLPDVRLLAMLRDPIERLVSDFRFREQRAGSARTGISFEDYCHDLLDRPESTDPLSVGHYAEFLAPFQSTLGADRLSIRFSRDLAADALAEMRSIASDTAIDPAFYDSYAFDTHNRTIALRSQRLQDLRLSLEPSIRKLRRMTARNSQLHQLSSSLFSAGGAALDRLNERGDADEFTMTEATRALLRDHYAPHDERLAELADCEVPWA